MRLRVTLILTITLSLSLSSASAQSQSVLPIIGIDNHALYAINSDNGDTRLLIEFDAAQLQNLADAGFHIDLAFDAQRYVVCCRSPNGRYFAFTQPIFELIPALARLKGLYWFPNNIQILEPADAATPSISLSHQPTNPATLLNKGKANYYEHLVWSLDSTRLYAIENELDLRAKRILSQRIIYFEIATGKVYPFARLKPDDNIDGLFAIDDGLFTREITDVGQSYFRYTSYDKSGQLIHQMEINATENPDLRNFYDSNTNPIRTDGAYQYAFSKSGDCGLAALVQPFNGTVKPVGDCYAIANVSRLAPTISLRLRVVKKNDFRVLAINNTEQSRLDEVEAATPWLYGLSPDGQSVAYIDPNAADSTLLFIWHTGQTRQMTIPYPISSITWSPLDYIVIPANP
jgi:hypothetical protein